jgi:hypothetical protein
LLKPKALKDKQSKKFKFNPESGGFEEEEESADLSFYSWIECFLIYMSIRAEYFPAEIQGLIRHMQNVQMLNRTGRDAIEYDVQFRTAKHQHDTIQWGEYLPELVDCLPELKSKVKAKPKTPHSQSSSSFNGKWNAVCNQYNTFGCNRTNCRYKHECRQCRGSHSVKDCKSHK